MPDFYFEMYATQTIAHKAVVCVLAENLDEAKEKAQVLMDALLYNDETQSSECTDTQVGITEEMDVEKAASKGPVMMLTSYIDDDTDLSEVEYKPILFEGAK